MVDVSLNISTYTGLVNSIKTYLERNDDAFIQNIPTFILLAQNRISREYKGLGAEFYFQTRFVQNVSTLAKPEGWLETVSFFVFLDDDTPMNVYLRSFEYVTQYGRPYIYPLPTTYPENPPGDLNIAQPKSIPLFFADYGQNNWIVAPTPDQAYKVVVNVQQLIQPISSDVQTNWVTQNAPEVLFYASLFEALIYLKDDSRLGAIGQLYESSMSRLRSDNVQHLKTRQNTVASS